MAKNIVTMADQFAGMLSFAAEQANVQIMDAASSLQTRVNSTNGVSTGSLALDGILRGGFPDKRWHTVYGPSMAGKTTISARTAAMAQAAKRPVVHIDAEYAADIRYFAKLGLNMKDTQYYGYCQPNTGDDAFRFMKRIMEKWLENFGAEIPGPLFVIDSLKALTPMAFMDDDTKNPIGLQARMFSTWLPPIKALIGQTNSCVLAINQVRQNPMQMFGSPETAPGGEALVFFADTIIRMSRVGKAEENDWGNSLTTRFNFKKCKHSTPGSSIDLQLIQGIGFDPTIDAWVFLKDVAGIADNSHGYYWFSPYEGLPELPCGLVPDKKYRWEDIVKHLVPPKGQHYMYAPLYAWCWNIVQSGLLFDAMATYEQENQLSSIAAGDFELDFTHLLTAASPDAFKQRNDAANESVTDDGETTKMPKGKKYDPKKAWRLNQVAPEDLAAYVGREVESDFYEDGAIYVCTVMSIDAKDSSAIIKWKDGGEEETVGLKYLIYVTPPTA